MSKQYLTTHTVDDAHESDIFSIAVTPTQTISCSGSSSLKIHSTTVPDYPLVQTLSSAHKIGCHHLCTSANGKKLATTGFDGSVKIWTIQEETTELILAGEVKLEEGNKPGEIWAIALSEDGRFLAATSYDGKINVWDLEEGIQKIREFETKGSFGTCIALSKDGKFTASGHTNGGVYVFNNETGRMLYSLPGLVKQIRSLAFSPASTLLAAAGDSQTISIYSIAHGEQIANLTGNTSWILSLDFSHTGEYLLSGAFDGKAKVWSIESRNCVATHSETEKPLWCVKWLPKINGKSEAFVVGGGNRSLSFYREATGG